MAKDKIKVDPSEIKTRKKVSGYGLLGTKYKKNPKYRDKPRNKRVDIREMNDSVRERELDPFEQAIKEVEKEFNINLAEGTCGSENEEGTGFTSQQKADMNKLIQQYQGQSGDVRSSIGDDLEMLEYQPDEIPPMIEYITSQLASNS